MAGDWIPLDVELHNKPKVLIIARATNVDVDETVGRLTRFWCWAQKHTADGKLPGLDVRDLIIAVGYESNFWDAVQAVGWLKKTAAGFAISDWDEWLSKGVKARLLKNRRQSRWRGASVDGGASTKASTIGEDRKGKDNTTPSPPLPFTSEQFKTTWEAWVEHRREIKKPLRSRGAEMALNKLKGMGEAAAIEAMQNSMAGGWQGLFEPSRNGKESLESVFKKARGQ